MKNSASIILAGGRSTRMGSNKAFLPFPGKERLTFIELSPANFVRLHRVLEAEAKRIAKDPEPMLIEYRAPDAKDRSLGPRRTRW